MTPRLGTKYLFDRLLRVLRPDLVCDVGSMDASDALRFRRRLPGARIVAFEANPRNLTRLAARADLRRAGIEIVPRLVWNADGERSFFVERVEAADGGDVRHGISSSRPRTVNSLGSERTRVAAVRLDSFAAGLTPAPRHIALWIDVEGAAYEVLEGAAGIAQQVVLVHVEVETRPFWQGQRLKPEVAALAGRLGLMPLARGFNEDQHDLVLVRRDAFDRSSGPFRRARLLTHLTTNRLRVLHPAQLREWAAGYRSARR